MSDLETLRSKYLRLVNVTLPTYAKTRNFPVHLNHCFGRIILDTLFCGKWDLFLDRKKGAAYKQLSEAQLALAIEIAEKIIYETDDHIRFLNEQSLKVRGKSKTLK